MALRKAEPQEAFEEVTKVEKTAVVPTLETQQAENDVKTPQVQTVEKAKVGDNNSDDGSDDYDWGASAGAEQGNTQHGGGTPGRPSWNDGLITFDVWQAYLQAHARAVSGNTQRGGVQHGHWPPRALW